MRDVDPSRPHPQRRSPSPGLTRTQGYSHPHRSRIPRAPGNRARDLGALLPIAPGVSEIMVNSAITVRPQREERPKQVPGLTRFLSSLEGRTCHVADVVRAVATKMASIGSTAPVDASRSSRQDSNWVWQRHPTFSARLSIPPGNAPPRSAILTGGDIQM